MVPQSGIVPNTCPAARGRHELPKSAPWPCVISLNLVAGLYTRRESCSLLACLSQALSNDTVDGWVKYQPEMRSGD